MRWMLALLVSMVVSGVATGQWTCPLSKYYTTETDCILNENCAWGNLDDIVAICIDKTCIIIDDETCKNTPECTLQTFQPHGTVYKNICTKNQDELFPCGQYGNNCPTERCSIDTDAGQTQPICHDTGSQVECQLYNWNLGKCPPERCEVQSDNECRETGTLKNAEIL